MAPIAHASKQPFLVCRQVSDPQKKSPCKKLSIHIRELECTQVSTNHNSASILWHVLSLQERDNTHKLPYYPEYIGTLEMSMFMFTCPVTEIGTKKLSVFRDINIAFK